MRETQGVRAANDNLRARLRPPREAYRRAGELVAMAHANSDPEARAQLFRKAAEALNYGVGFWPREPGR